MAAVIAPENWKAYNNSLPLVGQHNAPICVCITGTINKYEGVSIRSAPGEGTRTDAQRATRRRLRAEGKKA